MRTTSLGGIDQGGRGIPSGDPLGIGPDRNLYRYAYSNSIRKYDPLGLELDTVGCDSIKDSWETPCKLECGAAHDECYKKNSCSEGSWGFLPCGKLGKYVTIPGDFATIKQAQDACQCDYSQTCKIPLPPPIPPKPTVPSQVQFSEVAMRWILALLRPSLLFPHFIQRQDGL